MLALFLATLLVFVVVAVLLASAPTVQIVHRKRGTELGGLRRVRRAVARTGTARPTGRDVRH